MKRTLLILALTAAAARPVRAGTADDAARTAIVEAVRSALGANVEVRVDALRVRGEITRAVVAKIAPGARTATATRFMLVASDASATRLGEAEAVIFASAPHVRAAQPLHRGEALAEGRLIEEDGDLGAIPLRALPRREALAGAVASREIAQGEVITAAAITAPAIVHTGDKVVVRAAAGPVYIQAVAIAAQPGTFGDIIRCVNPDTRKAMTVRIVAPGIAEVLHAY